MKGGREGGAGSPWRGRRVLITAGPTREYMDPVRFLTNASSGLMGFAVARAARERGAAVTVVSGPVPAARPRGVRVVPVVTAAQMRRAALALSPKADVFVAAAAVGDWRFERLSPGKIKKTAAPLNVKLIPNPDILADVARAAARRKRRPVLVGFALETSRRLVRAREKLERKGLDLIVVNGPESLGSAKARVAILDRFGKIETRGPASKPRAAAALLRRIEDFLGRRG